MRKKLLILVLVLYFFPSFGNPDISPQLAEYAKIKITQKINFFVNGAEEVKVLSYIPQEDEFQKILSVNANAKFKYVKDAYGNKLLEIYPSKNQNEIVIETFIEIKRRYPIKTEKNFLFETNLTKLQSEFPLSFGYGSEFDKIVKAAKWVYDNLEYDESLGDKILSAQDVFRLRKGVCDEYSTLLISFLKKLGMQASYEVGYAFDRKDFRAHGWVRVYGDKLYDIDPTWCEFPVDALHIKFASLPDPVFNETQIVAKGVNPEIKIYPQELSFEIIEIKERPLVNISFNFFDERASYGSYVLGEIKIFSNMCVLSTLELGSCIDRNNNSIMQPYAFPKCVYFCNASNFFAIFNTSYYEKEAYCTIAALSPFGKEKEAKILLYETTKPKEKVNLVVEKNKVKRGEEVKVKANGHIFTLYGDYAFKQGVFKIFENTTIYALNGNLEEKKVEVVKNIPLEAEILNATIISDAVIVTLKISNKLKEKLEVEIISDTENITKLLSPEEEITVKIKSIAKNPAKIKILSKDFSLILYETVKEYEKEKEKNLIERIFEWIIELLSSLI